MIESSGNVESLITEATREFGVSDNIEDSQHLPWKSAKRLDPVHGFIFQLKLLMLFLQRGISHQYSFFLGTEIKEAKKFDDLVFEYEDGGKKIFRLLQAKHKLDTTRNKITEESLLITSDGDFSLPKYFFSFRSAKKEKLFKMGTIKDVTICTNINFSDDILNGNNIKVERIVSKDDILDMKVDNEVQPFRYRFCESIVTVLKPKLMEYIVKTKRLLPKYNDDDIKEFLNCLVFAVNCPNEQELGKVIKTDIGKEFDFLTAMNVYNHLFVTMLNWLQGKEGGRFLSYEEGKEFLNNTLRDIPIWFNIKNPLESFTGRNTELDCLHNLLANSRETNVRLVCIVGIGGIGKSELARKYIKEYCQMYDNKIVWISAENYKTLTDSFHRVATEILKISTKNIDGQEKNVNSIVGEVYRFFSKGKSLIIFDNAKYYRAQEKFDDGLDRFLPSLHPDGNTPYILITSRNQRWPKNIEILKLDVLNEDEAVGLVNKTIMSDSDDILSLVRELQYFPLALQQAIAYIRVQDEKLRCLGSVFNATKYLKRFKEKMKQLLNFQFPEDSDNSYSKTIFVTWNVSLEAIKEKENGSDALEVFNILAYMASEDIPTEMFLTLITDEDELSSALNLLKQYSMVNLEGTYLSVHRLVQLITRIKLQEKLKEIDVLRKVLKLFKNFNLNSKNQNHAISAWDYSSKYKELLEEFCWFSPRICSHLIECGRYEEAFSFGQKAVGSLSALLTNSSTILQSVLGIKNDTGVALQYMGEYDRALKVYLEIFPAYLSTYGPNHISTFIIKSNIATIFHGKGLNDEALKKHQEVLDLRKTFLGEKHPHTLYTKGNIAKILLLEGNLNLAFNMFRELYEIQEELLGVDHSATLDTKLSIAIITRRLGNNKESIQMLQEICNIQEVTLEKSHPKFLHTKCCLAVALNDIGKSNEALKIFQEVLATRINTLGEHHSDVLKTSFYIANLLLEQCKFDKAVDIFEEIYEKQKYIKGENHPDTMSTQYCKGNALFHLGKYSSALQIYQEVFDKRTVTLGNKHRETLQVRSSIAGIFLELGEYDKALQQFQEVHTYQKSELGKSHTDTLDTKHDIGRTLVCMKEFDSALRIFQEVLEEFKNIMFPPEHPYVLNVKLSLADLFSIQNKHNDALKIATEVLNCQITIIGKQHFDTAETMFIVGRIFLRKGGHDDALRMLNEALTKFKEVLGLEHPKTQKINATITSIITLTNHG